MATKSNKITGESLIISISGQTANDTISIPAGYTIQGITTKNTTANVITGGLKMGTSDGGTEVVIALAIGANAIIGIPDATILLKYFSTTVDQTLYLNAVVAWNNASIDTNVILIKVL